jgi:hypothetical protein
MCWCGTRSAAAPVCVRGAQPLTSQCIRIIGGCDPEEAERVDRDYRESAAYRVVGMRIHMREEYLAWRLALLRSGLPGDLRRYITGFVA